MFQRNNRIWKLGFVYIKSNFASHQTKRVFMDWKFITKHLSPNILRMEHYYSSKSGEKERKKLFKIHLTTKSNYFLQLFGGRIWRQQCNWGFKSDTIADMFILIFVCARIKNNTQSASDFLLKSTVNPLTNETLIKILGLERKHFLERDVKMKKVFIKFLTEQRFQKQKNSKTRRW